MAVCTLLNQKGGVGKSTLAVNLAAVHADVVDQNGIPSDESTVALVSVDPQGSAVWWSDRVDSLPFKVVQYDGEDIEILARLNNLQGIEHVFVDTAGWLSPEDIMGSDKSPLRATLSATDLVIVPVPPEPLAFEPTARTIAKIVEPLGLPFMCVINNWDPRDGYADLNETKEFIHNQGWPLANTVIRHYKVHTRAAADGRVVTEYHRNRVALQAREDFYKLAIELAAGTGGH